MYEYEMLMESYRWKLLDHFEDVHYTAWINRNVEAKKQTGSDKNPKTVYVYSKFDKFFKRKMYLRDLGLSDNHVDKVLDKDKQRALFLAKQNKSQKGE